MLSSTSSTLGISKKGQLGTRRTLYFCLRKTMYYDFRFLDGTAPIDRFDFFLPSEVFDVDVACFMQHAASYS